MPNTSGQPRSRPGRKPAHVDNIFGTEEEIADRSPNRSLYTEFLPDTTHPSFTQIPPTAATGQSINRSGPGKDVGGKIKFAGGPGTPS